MNYHVLFEAVGQLLLIYLILKVVSKLFCQIDFFAEQEDAYLSDLKNQLSVLDPKLKDIKIYVGDQSYTINKRKIYICLKDENGDYYQRNMLVYVILHEFAHVLCDEIGHTELFFDIFNGILNQAAKKGLYDPSIPPLEKYCGMT